MKLRASAAGLGGLLAVAACGPIVEEEQVAPPAKACLDGRAIDPWKELLVVDDAVMTGDQADNRADGPLAFRHVMTRLAPEDPSGAAAEWLASWAPSLRCAWLRATTDNACDATCTVCARRAVDLARAPFRLVAVANRVDLSESGGGQTAEGRLLYAATDRPITVIFEFRLPGDRAAWATRWHALGARGKPGELDEDYVRALTEMTEAFVRAEHLAQVRVNDAASAPRARMLEFHLDPAAPAPSPLVRAGLRRTPPRWMDGAPALAEFLRANASDVRTERHELPDAMLADAIALGDEWHLPGVEEDLREPFAAATCDGCHGAERDAIDGGFHVSPHRAGQAKVSKFLFDPERRDEDELARRARVLGTVACGAAAPR